MNISETLTVTLPGLLAALDERVKDNKANMSALTRAGLIRATEYYRPDSQGNPRFLYLLYPVQKGEKRRRDYVGKDPENIAKARAGIERAHEYDRIERETACLLQRLREIAGIVQDARKLTEQTAQEYLSAR